MFSNRAENRMQRINHFLLVPLFSLFLNIVLAAADVGDEPEENRLSLQEYILQVLEQNQNLAAQRLGYQASLWEQKRESAIFEPELVASAGRQYLERENTVEQERSQSSRIFVERTNEYNAGIEGLLPLGTRYRFGTKLENISNSLTSFLSDLDTFEDEFRTFSGFTVTQPLLKDAGTGVTMAKIHLAEAASEIQYQELRRRIMMLIAQAETLYWDLVNAQEQVRMRNESVVAAKQILEDNQARVKAGKMSELEVLQAQAGLAVRQSQREKALQELYAARSRASTLLSELTNLENGNIIAEDKPVVNRQVQEELDDEIRFALENHPDYIAQKKTIEQQQIRLRYAENQRWPQLDLVASYGVNGLGDSPNDAINDITRRDYETWSITLQLRVPLGGNQRSKAEVMANRLHKQQALLGLKNMEIELVNQLKVLHEAVQVARNQLQYYQTVTEFNSELLENELQRLEAGKSDSRKVLELEEDLVESKTAEIESLVSYQKAQVELALNQGRILHRHKIEIAD